MFTLTFLRDELIYDINNAAFIEAQAVNPDNDPQGRLHALIIDITADQNADRINRVLNLAFSQCAEMLSAYTSCSVTTPDLNDAPTSPAAYVITLDTNTATISQLSLNLLLDHIHEYLTARALADYLAIVAPDRAQPWADRALLALDEARSTIATSFPRSRIATHWP